MSFRTVSIVGVGLIGGSLGLALKKYGFGGRILGVSRPRTIDRALEAGAIDAGAPIEEALAQSDLIYLAQPILRILDQLPEIARLAKPGSLVTDAGSTKVAIVERAAKFFQADALFLGGHPMAGKEGRGVEIADPDLFRGAPYVLTPDDSDDPRVARFRQLLLSIGARAMELSATGHDEIVAWTSHLPQIASSALAARLHQSLEDGRASAVAGSGLRDMTRLAGSSYEMWEGIFRTNHEALDACLEAYISELSEFRKAIKSKDLEKRFRAAQIFHKQVKSS